VKDLEIDAEFYEVEQKAIDQQKTEMAATVQTLTEEFEDFKKQK